MQPAPNPIENGVGSEGVAPAPKKGKGCLIALVILGGFLFFIAAAFLLGSYLFFAKTDLGGKMLEMKKVLDEAANAPGTAELRALGCDSPRVTDMKRLRDLSQEVSAGLVDAGEMQAPSDSDLLVLCPCSRPTPPDCSQVAATYVAAIRRASGSFVVMVSTSGNVGSCSEKFAADGTRSSAF